jgi:hypothetical protein
MLDYEDELICDFVEEYHVFDIYSLDCGMAATLAAGLRQDSRVKSKMAGLKAPMSTVLLAAAVDRLSLLIWKDPKKIVDSLIESAEDESVVGFDSIEDFEAYRKTIVKR